MHCNTLQCTATHCNALQHTAPTVQHTWILGKKRELLLVQRCPAGQKFVVAHRCNTLQLQCTATPTMQCSTVHHSAIHCTTVQHTWIFGRRARASARATLNTRQHTATLSNSLQHTWIFGRRARASACATLNTRQHTATLSNSLQLSATHLDLRKKSES